MKKFLAPFAALCLCTLPLCAAPPSPALRAQAQAATAKAAAWLAAQQQPDGHWSNPDTPALTALAFWALHQTDPVAYASAINRGLAYVLQFVHPDGSIFKMPSPDRRGGGLANYNTAVCMMAIHALARPENIPLIQQARRFIASTQNFGQSACRGGMGYDPKSPRGDYADLSNSYMSYEAMRLTQSVEDLRAAGETRTDLDWDAVQQFLAQVQNLPSVNDQPWAAQNPDDLGGFVYTPSAGALPTSPPPSTAAYRGDRDPAPAPSPVRIPSFGSMTYAGLLSLIYANVSHDDPRVLAAQDWARKHWTLDENPGKGNSGLFYFYNILVKCLDAYGQEIITLPSGLQIPWRQAVLEKFLSLQQPDATWINDNNRFWEADPVLVTSYILLSIPRAIGPLPQAPTPE